jgi:hypothetical protein
MAAEVKKLSFGTVSTKEYTWNELFASIADSAASKANVGLYTKNLQRFFAYSSSLDMNYRALATVPTHKHGEFLNTVAYVVGILVQEEAMNGMKHNAMGAGLTISDMIRPSYILQKKNEERQEYVARMLGMKVAVVEVFTNLKFDFAALDMSVEEFVATFMAAMMQVALKHKANPALEADMFADQDPLAIHFKLLFNAVSNDADNRHAFYVGSTLSNLILKLQA